MHTCSLPLLCLLAGTNGFLLTITGENFGSIPPQVTVGGLQCAFENFVTAHTELVCRTPAPRALGVGLMVEVVTLDQAFQGAFNLAMATLTYTGNHIQSKLYGFLFSLGCRGWGGIA